MKRLLTAALLVLASNPLLAEPLNEYQSRWAEIKYQLSGSRQEKAFEDLNDDIHRELTMQPDDAGYLRIQGCSLW